MFIWIMFGRYFFNCKNKNLTIKICFVFMFGVVKKINHLTSANKRLYAVLSFIIWSIQKFFFTVDWSINMKWIIIAGDNHLLITTWLLLFWSDLTSGLPELLRQLDQAGEGRKPARSMFSSSNNNWRAPFLLH